ncbi:hypothetical protein PDE_00890 [Penicillium oxalicum 114-2]|uniref:Uncharacterized protein n=1 Tax=Penicillium oxalicum (strain 114-2 / CGMCC 5302) TaxID=933388 RepID=S7Z729_PENO1|nr:hypothetical protein PDE_00890 [Penicillium oxalicum 114-2]
MHPIQKDTDPLHTERAHLSQHPQTNHKNPCKCLHQSPALPGKEVNLKIVKNQDDFKHHRLNIIFNAFLEIIFFEQVPQNPLGRHHRERLRLSDLIGSRKSIEARSSSSSSSPFVQDVHHQTTPTSSTNSSPKSQNQSQSQSQKESTLHHPPSKPNFPLTSPDGNWLPLNSISLTRLHDHLHLISHSFNHSSHTIWWDPRPWNTGTNSMSDIHHTVKGGTKQGRFPVTDQRNLVWAVYRSFDAPWHRWRGRTVSADSPVACACACSEEEFGGLPRFSIIVRCKKVEGEKGKVEDEDRSGDVEACAHDDMDLMMDRIGNDGVDDCANELNSNALECAMQIDIDEGNERLAGDIVRSDELEKILCAIINEPLLGQASQGVQW